MEKELAIGMLCVAALLGAVAQIFLKTGSDLFNLLRIVIGVGLYGVAMLIYLVALRELPLSVAYPILAITYILVPIFAMKFLAEPYTATKFVGSAMIVLGVWVVAR